MEKCGETDWMIGGADDHARDRAHAAEDDQDQDVIDSCDGESGRVDVADLAGGQQHRRSPRWTHRSRRP